MTYFDLCNIQNYHLGTNFFNMHKIRFSKNNNFSYKFKIQSFRTPIYVREWRHIAVSPVHGITEMRNPAKKVKSYIYHTGHLRWLRKPPGAHSYLRTREVNAFARRKRGAEEMMKASTSVFLAAILVSATAAAGASSWDREAGECTPNLYGLLRFCLLDCFFSFFF